MLLLPFLDDTFVAVLAAFKQVSLITFTHIMFVEFWDFYDIGAVFASSQILTLFHTMQIINIGVFEAFSRHSAILA